MTLKRSDVLLQVIELRDYMEQYDRDLKHKYQNGKNVLCVDIINKMSTPAREVHVHIDAEFLDHCAEALADSLMDRIEPDDVASILGGRKRRAVELFKSWGWLLPWIPAFIGLFGHFHR